MTPFTISPPRQKADLFRRITASVIDIIVVWVLQSIVTSVLTASAIVGLSPPTPIPFNQLQSRLMMLSTIAFLVPLAIYLGYYAFFAASRHQATPGKILMNMHIAKADGSAITLEDALKRAVCYVIDALTLGFGYFIALSNDDRRALHDKICDTDVLEGPA